MPYKSVFSGRKLLILSPRFFGYEKDILEAALRIGFQANWIDARPFSTVIYKSALKVVPQLTRILTQKAMIASLDNIDWRKPPSDILLIKGDGITIKTLRKIRSRAPNAKITLYLWDGMQNAPSVMKLAVEVDRRVTFDPNDARDSMWEFLPLFARQLPHMSTPILESHWDWSFVGSIHSDRHRILRKLASSASGASWMVHAYIPSILAKIVYALKDPGLLFTNCVRTSGKILSAGEIDKIRERSAATIDIQHPCQLGLTIRTLETLLQGRKLITTNKTLKMYDLYHPSRVAILDRKNPKIDLEFLQVPFKPIPDKVSQQYYIDDWLIRLLSDIPLDSLNTSV
jgi:hypothetical protein